MNAGFSNLDFLKKQMLASSMQSDKKFDGLILSIGLGVAGQFARFCNREWQYRAGIKEVAQGDRSFWYVRTPPVTQFTKVELRFFRSDNWTDISGQPLQADEEKGLIHFGYTLGRAPIQFRVTYSGGYLWNILEPDDSEYVNPVVVPDDIQNNAAGLDPQKFMLPDELKTAWLLQCKHIWKGLDKVGTDVLKSVAENTSTDFAPTVERTLGAFKRYQIT